MLINGHAPNDALSSLIQAIQTHS